MTVAMSQEIIVTASVRTKAGFEDAVAALLLEILAGTVTGPGADGLISFEVNQAASDPTLLTSYEKWRTQEALNAHLASIGPVFEGFVKQYGDAFLEPPAITTWKQLGKAIGGQGRQDDSVIGALQAATSRISGPLERLTKSLGGT
jgi:quinol monooxygenase YgiN